MFAGGVLTVQGGAYELGVMQGSYLANQILSSWSALLEFGAMHVKCPRWMPKALFARTLGFKAQSELRRTFEQFPEFYERFRGIAEGCGISFWKLALLHYTEALGADAPRLLMGCTSIAVVPPRSDEPILAKNFDFVAEFEQFNILRKSLVRFGYSSVELTLAPLAGSHTGFNEAGLAVTYNYGVSREKPRRAPLITARVQDVLQHCALVQEAVPILRRKPNIASGIVTIIDAEGNCAAVELSPDGTALVEPRDGVIANANLFQNRAMQRRMIPFDAVYGEDAPEGLRGSLIQKTNIVRTRRLETLLARERKITVELLKRILADHGEQNEPSADTICRHHESFGTQAATIILPKRRRIIYLLGKPCQAQWREMEF